MSRWPRWISDALSPTPSELDAIDPGPDPDLVAIVRDATSPLSDELAVMARRPIEIARRSPRRRLWLAPAVLVVAVAMVWWFAPRPAPAPYTDLPVGEATGLAGGIHALGPDIALRGIGDVLVEAAGPDGTVVRVVRGAAHFEVDPEGTQRDLRVLAGDTVVEVRGTIFDVYFLDGRAAVDVTRGEVRVSGTWTGSLTAGQSWTSERVERVVRVEGPPRPVPDPVVVRRVAEEAAAEPDLVSEYLALFEQMDDPDVFARDLVRQIDDFISAYPDSAFVQDATALRLEVDARIRPVWQMVPDIDAFLEDNPGAPRRMSLLELRATLLRENQDCEGALPTYRILAESGKGALRARAEAWRGLCAHQLGRDIEARRALATALSLGVPHPLEAEVRAALEARP
jgi:hypothetical protein